MSAPTKHPAKFSKELIPVLADVLRAEAERQQGLRDDLLVLDPFAGTGRIHDIARLGGGWVSYGIELEEEWAIQGEGRGGHVIVGNALLTHLRFPRAHFDAVLTSPAYGNRFADKHNARDGSTRRSYTHDLGRKLSDDNAGAMQWGEQYRDFHRAAWASVVSVLSYGGLFVLNISDHVRNFERQPVTAFHVATLCDLGLEVEDIDVVSTRRMRYGANHDARPLAEYVITFRKRDV